MKTRILVNSTKRLGVSLGLVVSLGVSSMTHAEGARCWVGNTYQEDPSISVPAVSIPDSYSWTLINLLSQAVLFRDMDPSGMANFQNWIRLGGYYSLVNVAAAMATGSDEWQNNQCPSHSDQEVLNQIYNVLFSRYPNDYELRQYSGLIDQGYIAYVLRQIVASNEFYVNYLQ